jgi:hypothetical protein
MAQTSAIQNLIGSINAAAVSIAMQIWRLVGASRFRIDLGMKKAQEVEDVLRDPRGVHGILSLFAIVFGTFGAPMQSREGGFSIKYQHATIVHIQVSYTVQSAWSKFVVP